MPETDSPEQAGLENHHLADWLEQAIDHIIGADDVIGPVIFEGIIRAATTGRSGMLESVLDGMARNAVATEQSLRSLLASLHIIKQGIYDRLEAEVDPTLVWDMLFTLEEIFLHIVGYTTEIYAITTAELQSAHMAESAKVNQEAERRVYDYAAKLARANRELIRLEKAKTDFISIAAHELKTPLSVMMGYADMLTERGGQLPTSAVDLLQGMVSGAERLEVIIDTMLDISALETDTLVFNRTPVALGPLVKTVVERTAKEAQDRGHQFSVQVEADMPPFHSDAKRLHQVLDQVLNNAIKYTPDSGRIGVNVWVEREAESGHDSQDSREWIKIEINDTGIGIAPEDRDHIFDKFYRIGESGLHSSGRLKFKGAGPGLGLSIAKGIIEALDGWIWVESPGHDEVNCPGSTFHIRLPLKLAPI